MKFPYPLSHTPTYWMNRDRWTFKAHSVHDLKKMIMLLESRGDKSLPHTPPHTPLETKGTMPTAIFDAFPTFSNGSGGNDIPGRSLALERGPEGEAGGIREDPERRDRGRARAAGREGRSFAARGVRAGTGAGSAQARLEGAGSV